MDAADTTLDEGELYLNDQTATNVADTTLDTDRLYLNDQATLDVTGITFNKGGCYINKIEDLAYLSACVSDSTSIDTCIGTILSNNDEVRSNNSLWSVKGEFLLAQAPVKTSLLSKLSLRRRGFLLHGSHMPKRLKVIPLW